MGNPPRQEVAPEQEQAPENPLDTLRAEVETSNPFLELDEEELDAARASASEQLRDTDEVSYDAVVAGTMQKLDELKMEIA